MRTLLNSVVQTSLATARVATSLTANTTWAAHKLATAVDAGVLHGRNKARRAIVPEHWKNDATKDLSYKETVQMVNDAYYQLDKMVDGRGDVGDLLEANFANLKL